MGNKTTLLQIKTKERGCLTRCNAFGTVLELLEIVSKQNSSSLHCSYETAFVIIEKENANVTVK